MQTYRIRVVIADDHPAVIMGIKCALAVDGIDLVGVARHSGEIVSLLDSGAVDVLLSDYAMPGGDFGDGLSLFQFIARRYPAVRCVVMTMMDNAGVLRALASMGVRCIVSKSDDASHIVPAIHVAHSGGQFHSPTVQAVLEAMRGQASMGGSKNIPLSRREAEVVRLYVSGLKVGEIATRLCRSKQTVSSQKGSAMKKIGVSSDAELFKYASETGLLAISSSAQF